MEVVKKMNGEDWLALEITVLSAESLKKPSSSSSVLWSLAPLRPYVELSSSASTAEHRTRVDNTGEGNPTWQDTVQVPVDPAFLRGEEGSDAAVHVSVLSKRGLAGPARLGWCLIAPADVIDGLHPPASRRHLSYALRVGSYGGRGHGVVHLEARLVGPLVEKPARGPSQTKRSAARELEEETGPWWGPVVVGIPVTARGAPVTVGGCGPRGELVFRRRY